MISIYKGFHSDELYELFKEAWAGERTLILCPPRMQDFSFREKLQNVNWPEKPILGVFTSGTSLGEPRLVLYSKKNILASLNAIFNLFEKNRIGEIFCYPQPTHTFGLLLGYAMSLHLNVPLRFHAGKYSSETHRLRASLTHPNLLTLGTPTHFRDLLSFLKTNNITLAPSYSCIVGGSPVSCELWTELHTTLNIESPSIGYGATEASPGMTHLAPGVQPQLDSEVGSPLSSLQMKVSPEGVFIQGESLCMAILDKDGLSFPQKLLIRDDLVEVRPNTFQYRGRLDFVLNRGGEKFYLESIENTIRQKLHCNAIAIAIPNSRLNEDLGLLIEESAQNNNPSFKSEKQTLTLENLNLTLQAEFGISIEPENIKFTFELPVNASAKYDRIRAKEHFLSHDISTQKAAENTCL